MTENFDEIMKSPEPDRERPYAYAGATYPSARTHSYTQHETSEDGKFVKIISHSERIEAVPQPLTPEEIAAIERENKIVAAVGGTIVVAFLGVLGWLTWQDEKSYKENRPEIKKPANKV